MSEKNIETLVNKIVEGNADEQLESAIELQELIMEKPDIKKQLSNKVIDLLKIEKNPLKLIRIVWIISIFELEEVKPYLKDILKDSEGILRENVVLSIGILKEKSLIDELIKIMKNKDDIAREEAAISLGLMKVHDAFDSLVELLDDKDIDIVLAACLALACLGDKKAIKPLTKKLVDSNKFIRKYAAKAIFSFGKEALEEVKASIKELPLHQRIRGMGVINKLLKDLQKSDFIKDMQPVKDLIKF